MLNRREFVTLSGAAAAAATLTLPESNADAQDSAMRDYYELRKYTFADADQIKAFHSFMKKVAIPAYNRIGVAKVGVFVPMEDDKTILTIAVHPNAESVTTATAKLLADATYRKKGADFLETPSSAPAYTRIETSLMLAFKGMPTFETPVTNSGRIYEFRNYQSHSVLAGQKKIEMFNSGEIDIMRNTDLNHVLYGEHITGSDMPNLTYVLSFKDMDAHDAGWKKFVADPAWKKISSKPEYANKAILSGISNLFTQPTKYSQI
jgi:NIPSNAP